MMIDRALTAIAALPMSALIVALCIGVLVDRCIALLFAHVMRRYIARIQRTAAADPAPGQVWQSEHSGSCLKVESVETTDYGDLMIYVSHHAPMLGPNRWTIPMHFATGLPQWRRRMREQSRRLLATGGIVPPTTRLVGE